MEAATSVTLSLPAQAAYARSVRMMAANLAVVCEMNVDDVEDVRMAAGEGFVYACATAPDVCDVAFSLGDGEVHMNFSLGSGTSDAFDEVDLNLIELLLSAVCDDFDVSEDGRTLHLVKRAGAAHAE